MIGLQQEHATSDQMKELSAICESISYLEEEAKKIGHTHLSGLLKNILDYAHNDVLKSSLVSDNDALTQQEFEDFYRLMGLLERIDARQQRKMHQLLNVITFYHSTKK